ncbi:MAG: glutathione-independent formaldehyde dehydrogenase [Acidobacteriaceae bacterium]
MKAVSYEGVHTVSVGDHPKPKLSAPTDAILRVTTSGICGSDLHMYDGRTPLKKGTVLGHEIMGVIDTVGDAVKSVKVGDRVVLPFNIACGYCFNCHRGFTNACLTMNASEPHAGYGYAGMGPYQGGQAEYVLVPYADFNAITLPGKPGDKWEDDFLLLSDIFPTGYHAAVLANVGPGKAVAVFGAGPVGLLAAYSSLLMGAAEVYVVDYIASRLKKAEAMGAIPINFKEGNPVEQIVERRKKNRALQNSLRPGEEKMKGVDCGIDAVGYQARADEKPDHEKATQVLDHLAELVNPTGSIGIIGVYLAPDPLAPNEQAKKGVYPLPIAKFWDNGISFGMGQTPVKKYSEYLRDLIIAGRAKPSQIVSHHIEIDEAVDAYKKWDQRADGYTKILIQFPAAKAA